MASHINPKYYDTTKMRKQYVKLMIKNTRWRLLQIVFLIVFYGSILFLIVIPAIPERLKEYHQEYPTDFQVLLNLTNIILFFSIWLEVVFVVGFIWEIVRYRETMKGIGRYGIVIDDKKLTIFWHRDKDEYLLQKIDFVYIDEDPNPRGYGWFVIKERTRKITTSLPRYPKKFWSKIPYRDVIFNRFPTEILLGNTKEFVEALRSRGIKVYWRKKGEAIVEEVK